MFEPVLYDLDLGPSPGEWMLEVVDPGPGRGAVHFPAERWVHIRTTNPIGTVFSMVRLRHGKTKAGRTRPACLTMVFNPMA